MSSRLFEKMSACFLFLLLNISAFLKNPLDEFVSKLPVHTYVIHSAERNGLVRSRLMGAQKAQGSILVFLDAHCECTTGIGI